MLADQALLYATLWEAAHLFSLAAVIPGLCLFVTWRYLRRVPLEEWSTRQIAVAWSADGMSFYLAMMVETAVAETVLPHGVTNIARGAYGVCIALMAATLVLTLQWLRVRAVKA